MHLHEAWPESRLVMVEDAGHSATEPGIRSALVKAMDDLVAG
jgi:proline iminopeptidase